MVLAADRHTHDPVAEAAGVACKALSPVGGVPMVHRVLGALNASNSVGERILCGPARQAVDHDPELRGAIADGRLRWMESGSSPASSARAAMESLPQAVPVLLTTADHALLSSAMVDHFCAAAFASGCDAVVALAPQRLVRETYPEIRRTVIKLGDEGYCSCNLFAFLTPAGRTVADFWRRIEQDRKKPLRVVGAFGWVAVLRYALGKLSLDEALERMSRTLGVRAGAVVMPFADAAVDVDTLEDWAFVQAQVSADRAD